MPTSFSPEQLLVPAITPFDDDGRLDERALERHVDEILTAGARRDFRTASGVTGDERDRPVSSEMTVAAATHAMGM